MAKAISIIVFIVYLIISIFALVGIVDDANIDNKKLRILCTYWLCVSIAIAGTIILLFKA